MQRELQLRIEEHAQYLMKILDEQQKAGSALKLSTKNSPSPEDDNRPDQAETPKSDPGSTEVLTHTSSFNGDDLECHEKKRPRLEDDTTLPHPGEVISESPQK